MGTKTNDSVSTILTRIKRERITSLLVEAVDHYSPTYAEEPAIRVFSKALKRSGAPYQLQFVSERSVKESRANLIVHLGPEPPELLFVGHIDTIGLWHDGEHYARVEGDTLYGLGAADMKGGCVAIVEALTALRESRATLKKGLCIALVVGEEEYGDGSQILIEKIWAPLTVIGEPTSLIPCTSHFGYLEVRLVSNGLRAHAALPHVGANAIHAMLGWMMRIIEEGRNLPFADELAINPSEIHGGEPYFVVAESCEAILDFHIPPHVGHEVIERIIEDARKVVAATHQEVKLTYEQLFWASGFTHDGESEKLLPLRNAYKTVGLEWQPDVFRSHSDANLFHHTGTLPLICGPGNLAVAHGRGECVSISEVERAACLYATMIYEACVK